MTGNLTPTIQVHLELTQLTMNAFKEYVLRFPRRILLFGVLHF